MKKKLTKRDLIFFLLGLFTIIIIDTAINWPDAKTAFMKGYSECYDNADSQISEQ